jgi:ABC-type uncharacterized transport system substrate-binding protein
MIVAPPPYAGAGHRRWRMAILLFVLLLTLAGSAYAHPHIWIDVTYAPVISDGVLTSLRIEWLFDEWYSAGYLADFDANRDRRFDDAEVRGIYENAFRHLDELDYFTFAEDLNGPLDIGQARDFTADVRDGRLVYQFTLDFDRRLARRDELVIMNLDPSNYIAFFTDGYQPSPDRSLAVSIETIQVELEFYGTIPVKTLYITRR